MKLHRHVPPILALIGLSLLVLNPSQSPAASLTLTGPLNLSHSGNLIANGSFEDHPDGINNYRWATGTVNTPQATPANWTGVGGLNSYTGWHVPFNFSAPLFHGSYALYFGNAVVSSISQTPVFNSNGLVTFNSPPTIVPQDASYSPPVTLSQTLTGLDTTKTYGLSFWASGEGSVPAYWVDGIFGLDVTGFNTVHLAAPGGNSSLGASHVYNFLLNPASSTTTITFTNWGHFATSTAGWPSTFATELVLDDVIVNLVPEPSSWALIAAGLVPLAIIALRRKRL